MGTCIFKAEDIAPLLEHTASAQSHAAPYGIGEPVPGLFFVHDQGVYLMSNGEPGLMREDGEEGHQVVYAQGMDPKSDEDWWEVSREAVGGDDFAELIPVQVFQNFLSHSSSPTYILVKVEKDAIQISAARARIISAHWVEKDE